MKKFFFVLIMAFMWLSSGLQAREETNEEILFREIPIVISAARKEQLITEAPSTIEVITARDIEDYGYETLADAVRSLPGMDVLEGGRRPYIAPRGLAQYNLSHGILVMIDGVIQNFPFEANYDSWQVFPLTNVKRIEVIRGPGSCLWGANAFSGIINIITKSSEDINALKISAEGGSFSTQKYEILGKQEVKDIKAILTARIYQTDGFNENVISKRDYLDALDLFAKVGMKGLMVTFNYQDRNNGIAGSTQSPMTQSYEKQKSGFANINYRVGLTEKIILVLQSYLLSSTNNSDIESSGVVSHYNTEEGIYNLGLNLEYRISSKNTLITGMDYKSDSVDTTYSNIGKKESNNKAFYLQEQITPLSKLTLTLGARYDLHSIFGEVISPRISSIYKINEETSFSFSYGQAFRAPSFSELYINLKVGPITIVGDENLKPEKIQTTELAVSHLFSNKTTGKITLFYSRTEDLVNTNKILLSAFPPPPKYKYQMQNLEKAEVQGGELSLESKITNYLSAFTNYSYQKAENMDTGKELISAPRHKANLGIQLKSSKLIPLKASFILHYVGEKLHTTGSTDKLPDYLLVNSKIIATLREQLDLTLTIYNLTNKVFEDKLNYPVSGRKIIAGLSYEF